MKTFGGTIFLISGFILLIIGSVFFLLKVPNLIWIFMISAGFILMMGSVWGDFEESSQESASECLK
jgi:hypothetical protein